MSQPQCPVDLAECLPPGTVETWLKIALIVPPSAYLVGGTGLAVHLHHRKSRDLDFMFDGAVAIDDLERGLAAVGTLATTSREQHSLSAVLDTTKLQFLAALGQERLQPTTEVAGIAVASIEDITAMKVKDVLDTGELLDYYDLMEIDRRALPIEEGVGLFLQRYGIGRDDQRVVMLLRSLGYLDDVTDDPALPVERSDIVTFWHCRVPEIARSFDRM